MNTLQQHASAFDDVRVQSNDDLSVVESDKTSDTSASLSANSENYDFMNVLMPLIRPKDSEDEEEPVVDDAKLKPKGKSSAADKGAPKRKSTAAILTKHNAPMDASMPKNSNIIRRQNTMNPKKINLSSLTSVGGSSITSIPESPK